MTADRGDAAPVLVLALSARWMAQALARVGHGVLACDLFGDADTRDVALAWARAGDPAGLALEAAQCRRSLQDLVAGSLRKPLGWLAGPGCEPLLAELQPFMDALGVPLIGNDAATVDAVRDPQRFFAVLEAYGLPHPSVSWEAVAPIEPAHQALGTGPGDRPAEVWLSKDAWGSGGGHIARSAGPDTDDLKATGQRSHIVQAHPESILAEPASSAGRPQATARRYWQRCEAGQPVSLLFLADGRDVLPLAWQRQVVVPHGQAPFVWQGVQGPLQLAPAMQAEGLRAAQVLTRAFGLCGLNSLDGLWVAAEAAGGMPLWLELNPRCSASMALYPDWPLMRWHLRACAARTRPDGLAEARAALGAGEPAQSGPHGWRGTQIVWADRDAWVDPQALAAVRAWPDCHDLPAEACHVSRGMPLMTVSATASTQIELEAALAVSVRRAGQLLLGVGEAGAHTDTGSSADAHNHARADADTGARAAPGAPPILFSLEFSA